MNREEELFRNRLKDLAAASERKQCPMFSDFLGLNEQNIFHSLERDLAFAHPVLFGGLPHSERQMLGFLPDALSFMPAQELFPIHCIRIVPSDNRYAQELGHRDILGAVLHLGIDRCKTGDIRIGEHCAYLFAHEKIAPFIAENLIRVRHTPVTASVISLSSEQLPAVRTVRIEGSVPSPRIDALIPMAFHASRSSMKELCAGGKVFRNGRLITDGSTRAVPGDIISVRGEGRFLFFEEGGTSKKGRIFVVLEKFV